MNPFDIEALRRKFGIPDDMPLIQVRQLLIYHEVLKPSSSVWNEFDRVMKEKNRLDRIGQRDIWVRFFKVKGDLNTECSDDLLWGAFRSYPDPLIQIELGGGPKQKARTPELV